MLVGGLFQPRNAYRRLMHNCHEAAVICGQIKKEKLFDLTRARYTFVMIKFDHDADRDMPIQITT